MVKTSNLIQNLRSGLLTPEEALKQFELPATHISEIDMNKLEIKVTPSGFKSLDEYFLLKDGQSELIIFGARPGMGKSSFMFQLAANVAKHSNVLGLSLEMDVDSIKGRLASVVSGIRLSQFQRGSVAADTLRKINTELSGLNLYLKDRDVRRIGDIHDTILAVHKVKPLSLVVVDYLQLIKTPEKGTRDAEIGNITSELKAIAKEIKCPIIVGSQLNRACENRGRDSGDYSPQLSDLRESGNIEQDADIVMFLSRPSVYEDTRPGEADIIIAKNRNGKTGRILMRFSQEQTRFYEYE